MQKHWYAHLPIRGPDEVEIKELAAAAELDPQPDEPEWHVQKGEFVSAELWAQQIDVVKHRHAATAAHQDSAAMELRLRDLSSKLMDRTLMRNITSIAAYNTMQPQLLSTC